MSFYAGCNTHIHTHTHVFVPVCKIFGNIQSVAACITVRVQYQNAANDEYEVSETIRITLHLIRPYTPGRTNAAFRPKHMLQHFNKKTACFVLPPTESLYLRDNCASELHAAPPHANMWVLRCSFVSGCRQKRAHCLFTLLLPLLQIHFLHTTCYFCY